jgi:RNA polymerase sigma factor (sigma-70 family)
MTTAHNTLSLEHRWSSLMVDVLLGEGDELEHHDELDRLSDLAGGEEGSLIALRCARARERGLEDALISQALVWLDHIAQAVSLDDAASFTRAFPKLVRRVASAKDTHLRDVLFSLIFPHIEDAVCFRGRAHGMTADHIDDAVQRTACALLRAVAEGQYEERVGSGMTYIRLMAFGRTRDEYRREATRRRILPTHQAASRLDDEDSHDPLSQVQDEHPDPERLVLNDERAALAHELYRRLLTLYRELLQQRMMRAERAAQIWIYVKEQGHSNMAAAAHFEVKAATIGVSIHQTRKWLNKSLDELCESRGIPVHDISAMLDALIHMMPVEQSAHTP